jgi:hypothetical protein
MALYKHSLDLLPQPNPEWNNLEQVESRRSRLQPWCFKKPDLLQDSSRVMTEKKLGELEKAINPQAGNSIM